METDAVLIARVLRNDDRQAFGELVRRHQSVVRGFLRRMLGGAPELADDLAQETFIKAHRGLRGYRGGATLSVWLCAIAANELRAEWRRRARRAEFLEEDPGASAPVDADPVVGRDLEAGLASLPEVQRAALVLCFEHGLTHEEAAAAMGCPLGTLKSHLSRGKARLRAWLEAHRETA
ncbi:MAG TPA: sigma-70 family RNA polymerase sigma factor [Steroidobacteraceae bacterium]|nr:sigma-70 family RNA polymerase sigma factor [Steroidobacteraceae bacterium]